MKERPILFSAPMVRGILDGRKTQTRRAVKPPAGVDPSHWMMDGARYADDTFGALHWPADEGVVTRFRCPYGVPGDLLWVRENCQAEELSRPQRTRAATRREREALGRTTVIELDAMDGSDGVRYPADGEWRGIESTPAAGEAWSALYHYAEKRRQPGSIVPAIHMPRWASRITLRITDLRVERLQDISDADSIAEGIRQFSPEEGWDWEPNPEPAYCRLTGTTPQAGYRHLWETINGRGAWDANPWVWVVTFERI